MDTKVHDQASALAIIKVLLVDDHPVVRNGYRHILEGTGRIQVVAEADNGDDGYDAYKEQSPDVVIMDLILPGASGLNAIRRITQRNPDARILVFTVHEDPLYLSRAREAGALGYIGKRSSPDQLIEAVRQVAAGNSHFASEDSPAVRTMNDQKAAIDQLTSREFEVFLLLAQGLSVHSISLALNISQNTAGVHQTRIMGKLELQNSAQLARLAIRSGLVSA